MRFIGHAFLTVITGGLWLLVLLAAKLLRKN